MTRPPPTGRIGAPNPASWPAGRRAGSRRTGLSARARSERKLGWMLCAPAVIVMLAGHRVPDRLRRSGCRCSATTSGSRTTASSSGFDNYGAVLGNSVWWQDLTNTLVITVVSVAIELVLGFAAGLRDAPGHLRPSRRAVVDPGPLRDHHRRRRVRLALRLRPDHRLRQRPAQHRAELVHRAVVELLRDHLHRGVEDDAVHVAAAAGRLHARAPGRRGRGPGRRRHRRSSGCARSSSR